MVNIKHNLIGISGKINSGKDLAGKILNDLSGDIFENKKFADKLKNIVCMLIGCTREQLEDRDFKEKELGEEWWYYTDSLFNSTDSEENLYSYSKYHRQLKNDLDFYIIKLTPRTLLQLLGTECGRQIIHPNIWVNALFADYDTSSNYDSNWIITDVRFPNEVQAIKDKGGIVIKINRDSDVVDNHSSETALDNYDGFDFVVDNNGSIDDLTNNLIKIINND
jgi:hypothetical protein